MRAVNPSTSLGAVVQIEQTLEEAFPVVDPGVNPLGSRVLVQIKTTKARTKGGIELPFEARETVAHNTQAAKVVAVGPLAFRNRNTMEQWPEGSWVSVGDYVRVPKFGGDRFEVTKDGSSVLFIVFNDMDLIARITGDPRDQIAYV